MALASFTVSGNNIDCLVGAAEAHLEQLLDLNNEETKTHAGEEGRSYKYTLHSICPVMHRRDGLPAGLWEATVEAVLSGWGIPE